jgi:hypothetical protein
MPDLIIKPAAQSGNKVIIQDQAGGAVITTADSGAAMASNVTGIPAAGVTGVLPVGVTGGSGLTTLASNPTVTLGSNATFPAGHIIKTGYTGIGTVSTYNSATFTASPLEIDHVAAASGSHIYICCQVNLSLNNATATAFKILKDDADIHADAYGVNEQVSNIPANITFYHHSVGTNYAAFSNVIQVVDETGSIVAGTTYNYRFYVKCLDAQTIYINRGATWYTGSNQVALLSSIYLAEIAQ